MELVEVRANEFEGVIRESPEGSADFAIILLGALSDIERREADVFLAEIVRVLKPGGLLFVQGTPEYLPKVGVYLESLLDFKYWIAVESSKRVSGFGLPTAHAGLLLYTKGGSRFNIKRFRLPHEYCMFCGKPLKDWGGKSHLMHPDGRVVSDVWSELPKANNYDGLSGSVIDLIIALVDFNERGKNGAGLFTESGSRNSIKGYIWPAEGIFKSNGGEHRFDRDFDFNGRAKVSEKEYSAVFNKLNNDLVNVVYEGDAVKVLKEYPDNSIDLVFADPPYNIEKSYNVYDDEKAAEEYVNWCNKWLEEYTRILKPTGSLFILNLPRWSIYHADYLNKRLYLQNWIVWDSLAEPRGKLLPAHYGLLFYTKSIAGFTFNYKEVGEIDARYYCRRSVCIKKRKKVGIDDKEQLTDIWKDIHRIRHKRDRDYHPCQLPEQLMERIIRLTTNKGDVVLDALAGTGTTALTALKLDRKYVAIDIDRDYINIAKSKLSGYLKNGGIMKEPTRKQRRKYTKKELQLELRNIAKQLGRLPTPDEVKKVSKYEIEAYFDMFPTWNKALKAAKLEVGADGS